MTNYKNKATQATGWGATLREIAVLLLIVFLIRTFGFGLYQVPTGSMETTMLVGERFFADKFTVLFSKPKRLDVISFNDPSYPYAANPIKRLFQEYVYGPANWTKRVIGVPGDKIRGVVEDGKPVVYVNDQKLDQPFVNDKPLIALWSSDMKQLREKAEREALDYVAHGKIDIAAMGAVIDHLLLRGMEWRSYVPGKPLDQQPYYRMTEPHVVNTKNISDSLAIEIVESGAVMQQNGSWFRLPQIPLPASSVTPPLGAHVQFWNGTDEFYVELGKGQYWLMGDNRRGSHDCRFFGPVEERLIHGKIIFRIWSIDSTESWWIVDLIKHPIDFWSRVRWKRFFQRVR